MRSYIKKRTVLLLTIVSCCFLFVSCQQDKDQSDPAITAGRQIAETDYPAVVKIMLDGGHCSGTFVSDTTLITAAHCVRSQSGANYQTMQLASSGVNAINAFADERFVWPGDIMSTGYMDPNMEAKLGYYDIGIIIFPPNTAPAIMPFSMTPAKVGDTYTIVGYGKSDHYDETSGGIKRMGTGQIQEVDQARIMFMGASDSSGSGQQSGVSHGDSGGALVVNNQLIGVISSILPNEQDTKNFVAHLQSPLHLEFFQRAIQNGAKIPALQPQSSNNGTSSTPTNSNGSSTTVTPVQTNDNQFKIKKTTPILPKI